MINVIRKGTIRKRKEIVKKKREREKFNYGWRKLEIFY